ncbi:MAG: YicC family protein [Clostridia bacterium]|nr:YicC family protein [Clostridia bacterium]
MLRSMTGYGRSQYDNLDYKITVEMKTVNSRFLEINVRLPKKYSFLEKNFKEVVQREIHRGRVEAWIGIEETGGSGYKVKVDKELAMDYYKSLKELANFLDISPQISIYELSRLEGVLSLEEPAPDQEEIWKYVLIPLEEALLQLVEMRRKEGANLKADLEKRNDNILNMIEEIEKKHPEVVKSYEDKLYQRIKEITGNQIEVDENRLLTEVAVFAEKIDISEEITRLKSHVEQIRENLNKAEPVGRKLDFILQEMHREINTISSKSQDSTISYYVVEVKGEIEKMREQVQNVE